MKRYATISVPIEIKAILEKAKGKKTWADYLSEECSEWQLVKGKKAFQELRQLLSKEDLEAIG